MSWWKRCGYTSIRSQRYC